MKIIINADDCGMSTKVNKHIEQAILAKKISSTTVMANMDDFNGAVELYKKYNTKISFGIHLNLTEGTPLIPNEILLRHNILKEEKGILYFTGNFKYKYLNEEVSKSIYKELEAQIIKVLNSGIDISHIDSHHHIHTGFFMLPIIKKIAKDYHINKIRRIGNAALKRLTILQNLWMRLIHTGEPQIITSDYFWGYDEFIKSNYKKIKNENSTIELMCHPGGIYHPKEEELMYQNDIEKLCNAQLISYYEL